MRCLCATKKLRLRNNGPVLTMFAPCYDHVCTLLWPCYELVISFWAICYMLHLKRDSGTCRARERKKQSVVRWQGGVVSPWVKLFRDCAVPKDERTPNVNPHRFLKKKVHLPYYHVTDGATTSHLCRFSFSSPPRWFGAFFAQINRVNLGMNLSRS